MMRRDKPGIVFYVSVAIVGLFVLLGLWLPERLNDAATRTLSEITTSFGWFYLITTFIFLVFAFVLAFGRAGSIRLGDDEEEPEYPFWTWLAMLFAAGMGIGLVFWGAAEPVLHYMSPPEGLQAGTPAAAQAALRYSFFHWGLQPWAIYTVIALSLAYSHFRKGRSNLISSTLYPLLGERVHGPIGAAVDCLAVIATVFGVATSLGLGAMQIAGGLHHIAGVPQSTDTQLWIIGVVTALFLLSATLGINKGIRLLSNLNLVLAALLLAFVIAVGPTLFVIDALTTTVGSYIGNLIPMSFRMTPFSRGTFVGAWTIFYWAWWISWAPFVGSFIARVSRGRTIREFVMGVLFVPTLLSLVWFAGFGGSSLYFEIFGNRGIAEAVGRDVTLALFSMLEQLPLGGVLNVLAMLLILVFFITSADSATFVLAMLTTGGTLNPGKSTVWIWGLLLSGSAAVLLLSGGLNGLQAAAIVMALPFAIIMLLMLFSTNKALNAEMRDRDRKEKRRIRRIEAWIEEEMRKEEP